MDAQVAREKIGKGFGLATWVFFVVIVIAIIYYVLDADSSQEFRRVMTYTTAFSVPFLMLVALSRIEQIGSRLKTTNQGEPLFFMKTPTMKDLALIPILIIVLYYTTKVFVGLGQEFNALLIAGFILGGALVVTRSIIVPILIHGTFNSLIYLDAIGLIDIGATNFPRLAPEFSSGTDLIVFVLPELGFQYFLVGAGEEMLRALIISVPLLLSMKAFEEKPYHLLAGVIVSSVIWALYHAIQNNIQIF